jgi:hypothetical protein
MADRANIGADTSDELLPVHRAEKDVDASANHCFNNSSGGFSGAFGLDEPIGNGHLGWKLKHAEHVELPNA